MKLYKRNKILNEYLKKYAIISNTDCDNLSIGICERHLRVGGLARWYYNPLTNRIINYKIKVSPYIIRHYRIKQGYDVKYYKGRKEKLSFLSGNFKLFYRFVILHELGHVHFYLKYFKGRKENSEKYIQSRREKYADSFALRYLKINEV